MTVTLLTKHHLEFLSLKGGCTGSSESTLVKMPHCWKSHVTAQIFLNLLKKLIWVRWFKLWRPQQCYIECTRASGVDLGLKTLLQQGISEPIFYGDLVYKFNRIVGKPNFSDQFKKKVKRYIRVGYNLDIMRQSACLVLNPITVYSYGFLFNCTTVGQASDSMTSLT